MIRSDRRDLDTGPYKQLRKPFLGRVSFPVQTDFLLMVLILFSIFRGSPEMHCRALSVPARGKFYRETGAGMLPTEGTVLSSVEAAACDEVGFDS